LNIIELATEAEEACEFSDNEGRRDELLSAHPR
jgi:hypothetical protein